MVTRQLTKPLIVYSFINKSQGRTIFYSADETQLAADPALKRLFLSFAAKKDTLAVTELTVQESNLSRLYSPLTLANTLTKKDEYLNAQPSSEVQDIAKQLPYIVIAKDLTTNEAKKAIPVNDIRHEQSQ